MFFSATICRTRQIRVRRYFVLADIASLAVQLLGTTFYCFYNDDDADFPLWILPIVLSMISLRWWANYVSLDSNIGKRHFYAKFCSLKKSSYTKLETKRFKRKEEQKQKIIVLLIWGRKVRCSRKWDELKKFSPLLCRWLFDLTPLCVNKKQYLIEYSTALLRTLSRSGASS